MRPIKGRGGIGMGRNPAFAPKGLKPGEPLRFESPKQHKRKAVLKEKLDVLLALQHELYGTERCETGFAGWGGQCWADSELVVDHVETRNGKNVDRWENLQILCVFHNGLKGSKRNLDFRPEKMKARLKALDDAECQSI